MTARQSDGIERALGRLEAQMEAATETLGRLDARFGATEESFEVMKGDVAELKRRADVWHAVTREFTALQQTIHDGKVAGLAAGKGFVLGLSFAAGAGGAVVATAAKGIWAWAFGA